MAWRMVSAHEVEVADMMLGFPGIRYAWLLTYCFFPLVWWSLASCTFFFCPCCLGGGGGVVVRGSCAFSGVRLQSELNATIP